MKAEESLKTGDNQSAKIAEAERLAEGINQDSEAMVPIGSFETAVSVMPNQTVRVVVEYESRTGLEKEALIAFQFFNSDGEAIDNPRWRNVSKAVGEYQYLRTTEPGKRTAEAITLDPPQDANDLYIRGIQWDERGQTFVNCVVETTVSPILTTETINGTPIPVRSSQYQVIRELSPSSGSVKASLAISAGEELGTCPLAIRFLDADGLEILGNGDLPQNPRFGSFVPLDPDASGVKNVEVEFSIPGGAVEVEFRGIDWGAKSCIVHGSPTVIESDGGSELLNSFIRSARELEAIYVIDTTAPPLGHDTLALRPNNLAVAYAELGYGVVFFPFGTLQSYPSKLSDRIVQFERAQFDFVIDSLLDAQIDTPVVYVCSSFPSLQSCTTATRVKAAGWKVVYECRDDMEEFNRVGYSKWYHPQLERRMLREADVTVSVSPDLDKKLVSLVPELTNHHIVPNGVSEKVVDEGATLTLQDIVDTRDQSSTFGYVGHLTESWFDWHTLIQTATNLPQVNFEIVGHGMPAGLELPDNVHYLGPKTHSELVPIVQGWRAGLIPFADLPLTRSVDPNKIYEYQAWGLRSVSAPMGMVERYPFTWVYRGAKEFQECILDVLATPVTAAEVAELRDFVSSCTWLERAKQMLDLI